jgi:hypothetical protein
MSSEYGGRSQAANYDDEKRRRHNAVMAQQHGDRNARKRQGTPAPAHFVELKV